MEKKTDIWNLNFAFLLSIFLHIYLIFFLTKSDFNFLDKKERVTITLSAIGTATLGAGTGTAVLTFGELVAHGMSSERQYKEMEDGNFETIDEWKEIVGGRKLLETFIGMYMLGGKGTITNMYKGMKADVARIVKKSTVRGGEAAKRMGIPVNSTNDTIKTTTATKRRESAHLAGKRAGWASGGGRGVRAHISRAGWRGGKVGLVVA